MTIGTGRERHGNDARGVAEAETQDQQGHKGQHRRRDEHKNVRRDDLLDEWKLGDDAASTRPTTEPIAKPPNSSTRV